MKYIEILLNEQEVEVLEKELKFILEEERSATVKSIIHNILEKIK